MARSWSTCSHSTFSSPLMPHRVATSERCGKVRVGRRLGRLGPLVLAPCGPVGVARYRDGRIVGPARPPAVGCTRTLLQHEVASVELAHEIANGTPCRAAPFRPGRALRMIRLQSDGAVLEIDPVRGGRLASLRIDGRELLVTPPDAEDRSIFWGSFPMAPWAGRIDGTALDWEGAHYDLPPGDGRNAIHGVVYDREWTVEHAGEAEAVLSCALGAGGWPLGGSVRQRIRLAPDGLVAAAEVEAERSMPAVIGWHPWLLRGPGDARVRVEAAATLETEELIPTGRRVAVDDITDLRDGPVLGTRLLDHVYPDPVPPAIVEWPDLELQIGFAAPITTLVVHSRPTAFCVEPQTAWPNAPALAAAGVPGTGLKVLRPGECLHAEMTWSWRATPRRG